MKWTKWLCVGSVLTVSLVVMGENAASISGEHEAVTITAAEIEGGLRPAVTGVNDVVLSTTSIGGEYNLGVFAVRRTLVHGKLAVDAYQHHDITEVYQVVRGSGTLVTGGTLEEPKELASDDPSVKMLMGPTAQGAGIKGGRSQHLAVGDIVVIPADTPHGFINLAPEGISYVLVRIDPHKVLRVR